MALPKQVQAQLAEVEELEKTLSARKDKPKDAHEPPKVVKKADTDEGKPDLKPGDDEKAPKAEPADKSPTDVASEFEQKYRTLRGKYDAEVPRLHQQVKDLTDKLEDLRKQTESAKAEQATKAKEKVSYVTDADREEFGEELIDVQRRVAREVADEFQERFETQAKVIEDLKKQIGDTNGKVGSMTFAQRLHQLVPDFEKVDNDERWIAWLNEHDPMLRGPRRVQAKAAFDAGDAEAIADYVRMFKQSLGAETPKAEDPRRAELEKQVAPSRTASAAHAQSAGKEAKIYSAREVDAAWQKIRVLNTRGQLDEAAKLEAEITAAYLEGRVR